MYLYMTDAKFQVVFSLQAGEQILDYFSRMEGFSGEQGYAHGRFVFDVAIMLLPGGNLKKLLDSWKRTKSFKLLDFLPAQYKNLLKATPSQKDLRVIEKVSGEVDFTKPIPVDAPSVRCPYRRTSFGAGSKYPARLSRGMFGTMSSSKSTSRRIGRRCQPRGTSKATFPRFTARQY